MTVCTHVGLIFMKYVYLFMFGIKIIKSYYCLIQTSGPKDSENGPDSKCLKLCVAMFII